MEKNGKKRVNATRNYVNLDPLFGSGEGCSKGIARKKNMNCYVAQKISGLFKVVCSGLLRYEIWRSKS